MNTFLEFNDLYSTAYASLKQIPVEFEQKGNRVIFLLPNTPATTDALIEYNSNPQIRVLDFVHHCKKIRAKMIALRT